MPSASEFEHKQHPVNTSTTVDQLEKPGMPNAITDGGVTSILHFANSLLGYLTNF